MKDLVRKAGREEEFHIQSAATHRDEIGSDTHYGTKEILKLKGVPFTPRHAVQMVKADYEKYDLFSVQNVEKRGEGPTVRAGFGGFFISSISSPPPKNNLPSAKKVRFTIYMRQHGNLYNAR